MRDTDLMTKDGHQPPMQTLADLRRAAGLTQVQVAQRMGVHQSRIGRIEKDYPNLHFLVVTSYIEALGGHIALTGVGGHTMPMSDIRHDPRDPGAQANRKQRSAQGVKLMQNSGTEELPLKQRSPQPSSDDTSRNVDEADTESDQGDREDSQQP